MRRCFHFLFATQGADCIEKSEKNLHTFSCEARSVMENVSFDFSFRPISFHEAGFYSKIRSRQRQKITFTPACGLVD